MELRKRIRIQSRGILVHGGRLLLNSIGDFFADWVEREHGRLPASLGYSLLVLALVIIIALPASGGWLLLPPAIYLIIRNKKEG